MLCNKSRRHETASAALVLVFCRASAAAAKDGMEFLMMGLSETGSSMKPETGVSSSCMHHAR